MTLADIGSGDGLIGFRAMERVGTSLQVLFTDISAPMLRHAEALAVEQGVRGQCEFLTCPADDLRAIPDATVDAVTTRAVLAYVADKAAAVREFHRILKPGGRLSLAEPIFYDDAIAACVLRGQTEKGQLAPIWTLIHRWKAAQFPDTPAGMAASPIANFSERSLFGLICAANFVRPHMELHIDMFPSPITSWEAFLNTSPHPLAPTLKQILDAQFNDDERRLFEAGMRRHLESQQAQCIERMAYLTATKAAR
jgi:arsenite methyltransferase